MGNMKEASSLIAAMTIGKVTCSKLAEYVGVATSTVACWRAGLRRPRYDSAVRVRSFFRIRHINLTIDSLLG